MPTYIKSDERVISLSLSSGFCAHVLSYVAELEEWYDPSISSSSSMDFLLTLYPDQIRELHSEAASAQINIDRNLNSSSTTSCS